MAIITKHYVVQGKVQQVGYRDYAKEKADALAVMGTAYHSAANTVTVVAQGEEVQLPTLEKALRLGPVMAFVKEMTIKVLHQPPYYRTFQVEGPVLTNPEIEQQLKTVRAEQQGTLKQQDSIND